jgi:hypothetical protein
MYDTQHRKLMHAAHLTDIDVAVHLGQLIEYYDFLWKLKNMS